MTSAGAASTTRLQALRGRYAAGELTKREFITEAFESHRLLHEYVTDIAATEVHEIRVTTAGVEFLVGEPAVWMQLPAGEVGVVPLEILNYGRYEVAETAAMDVLARGANQILDIGANVGYYSLRFALTEPQARIHAFEPVPHTYSSLQRNVARNGVGERVTTYGFGLSDRTGSVTFVMPAGVGPNASMLNVSGVADTETSVGLVLTLDEWAANTGVVPDFIKCDVEGAELLVLRGGEQLISTTRPRIFTELLRKWSKPYGYHPNDLIEFLAGFGYVCFAIGESGARRIREVTEETVETNYAFLVPELHAEFIAEIED